MAGGRPAIAIPGLPDNMSGDPEGALFFADSTAEAIITALSRFRSFLVISRVSSFAYRGRTMDVKHIASELGARYVMEGSVRLERDRTGVTAQLIEADSGAHIWAESYDCEQRGAFAIQDDITRAVAVAI